MPVWTRLEPEAAAGDVAAGLAAPAADPAWLLARQWQVGELTAEDAGSPIAVEVAWTQFPIDEVVLGGVARRFEPTVPLEAILEPEPAIRPSWRTRLTAGAALRDRLIAAGVRVVVPAKLAPDAVDDPVARALVRGLGDRALDGEAALTALTRDPGGATLLTALAAPITAATTAAVTAWATWYRARTSRAAPSAWTAERAAYQAELTVTTDAGRWALVADAYRGGRFDWAELRAEPRPPARPATPVHGQATLLPAPISFRGGPARRFFEFEDAAVDFGGLGEGVDELASRLLVEVALIYGGDWFVVPVELPVGGLGRLDRVAVRSTFGELTAIAAPRAGAPWRAFTLAALPDLLPILPTVSRSLDGPLLEQVAVARDEAANLAWLCERRVADGLDRGHPLTAPPAPAAPAPPALDRYRPIEPPPAGWRPWVQRGDVVVPAGLPTPLPPPRTALAATFTRLRAADLGRDGLMLERRWQVAIAGDGQPWAWIERRQRPGAGDLPSGLGFDVVDRATDPR